MKRNSFTFILLITFFISVILLQGCVTDNQQLATDEIINDDSKIIEYEGKVKLIVIDDTKEYKVRLLVGEPISNSNNKFLSLGDHWFFFKSEANIKDVKAGNILKIEYNGFEIDPGIPQSIGDKLTLIDDNEEFTELVGQVNGVSTDPKLFLRIHKGGLLTTGCQYIWFDVENSDDYKEGDYLRIRFDGIISLNDRDFFAATSNSVELISDAYIY